MATLNIFCASGGGSKGAFQGGVLEALCAAGVELHGLVGISTGSIQAGFISLATPGIEAQKQQMERLKGLWFGLKGSSNIYRKPILGIAGLAFRVVTGKPSIYRLDPLKGLLDRNVRDAPQRPVRLGVVDLDTGKFSALPPLESPNAAKLREAILASCSIPFFFPPVAPSLVDGGVREIAPLDLAFELAADMKAAPDSSFDAVRVYLALASPRAATRENRGSWTGAKAIEIGKRALALLENENYSWDIESAERVNDLVALFDQHPELSRPSSLQGKIHAEIIAVEPDHVPYSSLTFDPSQIEAFWDHGRVKAEAVL